MEKISEKNDIQLIEAAKERLRWFTMEASEEEYDVEQVDALVKLLNTMEPVEKCEDEQALERFHAYMKLRGTEDSRSEEHMPKDRIHTALIPTKSSKVAVFVKKHKIASAAAVIFIMLLVTGGSLGVVNAYKGNGFFYWLKRDSEGVTMLTSPENMDNGADSEDIVEYMSVEEVPEAYKKYLFSVESVEGLQDYQLENVRIFRFEDYSIVKRAFSDEAGEKKLYIGTIIYPDIVRLTRSVYLSAEVENGMEEGEILIRENPEGENEYTVFFYIDNIYYYVEGSVDKDKLLEIATECRNMQKECG